MKLIIDIPEDRYKWICQRVKENENEPTHLPMEYELIANGTPLPNITDIVHKTIYSFFDIADDNSEEPINEKDKLLLEVNKAICNNIKGVLKNEDSN